MPPNIVNVVATASLGRALDLQTLASLFPEKVHYEPSGFNRALVRVASAHATVQLFRSGRMIVSGARSPTAAKQTLVRVAMELGLRRPRRFAVANIVASWTLEPREANEEHHIENPFAYVKVCRSGHVFCTGAKSRADLKQLFESIQ
jgi:TATA-box binding protein (TBP) (component of TFIID and TFIIIB)